MSQTGDLRHFGLLAYERLAGPMPDVRRTTSPDCGAIVCLTRGYNDLAGYDELIARNWSIYNHINRHLNDPYPLIIFHEGNIPRTHQQHILAHELNPEVRFIDISSAFSLPAFIDAATFAEHWTIGYRLMCRFHTLHIWLYCWEYGYILRLDEDCILDTVTFDPIAWLRARGLDFGTATFVAETHSLTNQTLPMFVKKYQDLLGDATGSASPYNQHFPYTNFYVSRTGFWRQPDVQRFLSAVLREPDSLRFRWGDLPLLGVALNMYNGRIAGVRGVAYRHGSHNMRVVS
jgi:hypothetical protein